MGFLSGKVIQYIIISYNFEDFQSILKFSAIFFAGGLDEKVCLPEAGERSPVRLCAKIGSSHKFLFKNRTFFLRLGYFHEFPRRKLSILDIYKPFKTRYNTPHDEALAGSSVHGGTPLAPECQSYGTNAGGRSFPPCIFSCTFFQKRLDRGARMWYNTPAMKQNVPRSHLGGKGGRVDRFRGFTVFRAGRGFARFFVFSA